MKLRNILGALGLIALAVVAYLNRNEFTNVWNILLHIRWYFLVLVACVQVASYWINGLYYRSILKIFGYHVGVRRLFEGALATNFVNYVLPSAGIAGAGYLSQVLSPDVPRGESVLTQLMRYAFSGLAVIVTAPVGIGLLLAGKHAANPVLRATVISAAAITLLSLMLAALVEQKQWILRMVGWIASLSKHISKRLDTTKVTKFTEEFYAGWHRLTSEKRKIFVPFKWSILYITVEIGTFYMVFLAFGDEVNFGIAVLAYLFANIASIFGGVFFSTGVFEVGMAGTLVALGSPIALASSVTIVYRAVNLLVGLPTGYYFYRKYLP